MDGSPPGSAATLGARVAALSERRFVGRARERAVIEELFEPSGETDVLLIHGPGGIGKSSLLRLAARAGRARGFTPVLVEARELGADSEEIDAAVAPALAPGIKPLLLVDAAEHVPSLERTLRRRVVPALPEESIVVIASRAEPEGEWQGEGYVVRELEVGALDDGDAHELLEVAGVEDRETAGEVVEWAGGSPLALSLAADAARAGRRGWAERGAPADVAHRYVRRLLRDEADPLFRGALSVAAIARTTTTGVLRDALPEIDAGAAYAWLAERTYIEALGQGLTLHDMVRQAIGDELRAAEPELERHLRRRIIDHFYERAMSERDFALLVELTSLSEPVMETERAALRYDAGDRYSVDRPRRDDLERLDRRILEFGEQQFWAWSADPRWREVTRRFFAEAPERVVVARDDSDEPHGYVVSVTADNVPAFARDDPVLGPRLAHAAEHHRGRAVIVSRDTVDLTPEEGGSVQALLNLTANLRSGLFNTEVGYITMRAGHPFEAALRRVIEPSRALGIEITHMPELRASFDGADIECYMVEYSGGMLAVQRNRAYAALGLVPPAGSAAPASHVPAAPSRTAPAAIDADAVRSALKSFQRPHVLARSPLAVGSTPAERAESVKAELEAALDRAFGEGGDRDQRLRTLIERAYMGSGEPLEAVAHDMHVSRSTFYRMLREATERVVEAVLAARR